MSKKWIIALLSVVLIILLLGYYRLLPEVTFLNKEGIATVTTTPLEEEPSPSVTPTIITDKPQEYDIEVSDNEAEAIQQESLSMFYYEEIAQEIKNRIVGKSYGENCEVPFEDLRYVKVLYFGFDDKTHEGELIVNKAIAGDIAEIFKELYEIKYPIEQMVLVDEYDADDNLSMAANNTSSFNYREVDGTNRLSLHSYGLAIDINPFYNPYVREIDGKTVITPAGSEEYADRSLDCKYYIRKDDAVYQAFVSRGFTWGGDWNTLKDYQHFQKKLEDTP
ncbi:MAG: M15 family metallopeptidase [Mobilitalea sp.]